MIEYVVIGLIVIAIAYSLSQAMRDAKIKWDAELANEGIVLRNKPKKS